MGPTTPLIAICARLIERCNTGGLILQLVLLSWPAQPKRSGKKIIGQNLFALCSCVFFFHFCGTLDLDFIFIFAFLFFLLSISSIQGATTIPVDDHSVWLALNAALTLDVSPVTVAADAAATDVGAAEISPSSGLTWVQAQGVLAAALKALHPQPWLHALIDECVRV
jgi:hypothetical protein